MDRLDPHAPGPHVGQDDRTRHIGWRALTLLPAWRRGVLEGRGPGEPALEFELVERRGSIAELALRAEDPGLARQELCARLTAAGLRVLGWESPRGASELRLFAVEAAGSARPADWWPTESTSGTAIAGSGAAEPGAKPTDRALARMRVSSAAARALRRGHPWLLRDEQSDAPERFAPGSAVELRDPNGRSLGEWLVDGDGRVAARSWQRASRRSTSVESRVVAACERRRDLLAPGSGTPVTDAFRLIHGEADGLPGLAVDRLAGVLRVQVSGRASDGFRERVLDSLRARLADELGRDPPIVEVVHCKTRPRGRLECVRQIAGPLIDVRDRVGLEVRERGLVFAVDTGLAEPERARPGVGLYLDQRANRERLARLAARGGRWLNLFAHTGAFSVALAAAGAEEVVSVDLSAAVLRQMVANVARNGIELERCPTVRSDGRRYLERLDSDQRFDGILVDPPTAAAAGRRFWSVRRDLEPLLRQALSHLAPGGSLFVARNDRGGATALERALRSAATHCGVSLSSVQSAPPGRDFPRLHGFPEGDPFAAILARRG